MVRGFALCLFLLLGATVEAQTRYITDNTIVELRRGPSTEYLIVRNLQAGTAVEVLEQNADNGYSRVRVADQGTEGWILTRFLTAEPIARDKLVVAERNLTAARNRVTELEQRVAELSAELDRTTAELEQTRNVHGEVSRELADIRSASASVLEIRDENESLRRRLAESDQNVERLTLENGVLASRRDQNWFIVGAGVLFGGIVLGLILPSLRRKRRSDW